MDLQHRSWVDFESLAPSIAIVPTGSIEQHGPHAPLGTDMLIATEVARRGREHTDRTVAITPTIPVGVAEEHRNFTGSLWVGLDAFRAYVREVATSLASHGVEGVVFVNAHGGNVAALDDVAAQLTRHGPCDAASFTWFESLDAPPAPMGHGGLLETSAVLAIDPSLIATDRLQAAYEGGSDRWGRWSDGTNLAVDVDEFSENGVVGDPREAGAAIGDALLTEAGSNLAGVIEALATSPD